MAGVRQGVLGSTPEPPTPSPLLLPSKPLPPAEELLVLPAYSGPFRALGSRRQNLTRAEGRSGATLGGRMEEVAGSAGTGGGGGRGAPACSPPGISVSSLRGGTVSSLSVYILAAFRCR